MSLFKTAEVPETKKQEIQKPEVNNYKEIKPESGMTADKAKAFWDKTFDTINKSDIAQKIKLEKYKAAYFEELKQLSDVPDTLPDKLPETRDFQKLSTEETSKMREEFNRNRDKYIDKWVEEHGRPWPVYKEDVKIINKRGKEVTIRHEGDRYDAHHIQPLSMGGKNEASNITPLRADVHGKNSGIHRQDGPLDKMEKTLKGIEK